MSFKNYTLKRIVSIGKTRYYTTLWLRLCLIVILTAVTDRYVLPSCGI